jgi:hypothetical protein
MAAEFVCLVEILGRATGDAPSGIIEVERILALGACLII